jgi:hypothetical protein
MTANILVVDDEQSIADLIEVYSQGNTNGGVAWGVEGSYNFDVAQQYIVGHNMTTSSWSAWADKSTIATDAGFESAVTLNGDRIIYEIGVKQFINYGGISTDPTVVADLAEGTQVGFDIIADTIYSGGSSMISENMFEGKYIDAAQFQVYTLVNSLTSRSCGNWGYGAGDVNQDCRVNLADFATLALQWLKCNNPADADCTRNW